MNYFKFNKYKTCHSYLQIVRDFFFFCKVTVTKVATARIMCVTAEKFNFGLN